MEEFKASRKSHNSMIINWVLGSIAEMHRKPPTGWVSVTSRSRGEQIYRAKPEQHRLARQVTCEMSADKSQSSTAFGTRGRELGSFPLPEGMMLPL